MNAKYCKLLTGYLFRHIHPQEQIHLEHYHLPLSLNLLNNKQSNQWKEAEEQFVLPIKLFHMCSHFKLVPNAKRKLP